MSAGPWMENGILHNLPKVNQYGVSPNALIRAALTLELGDVFYAMDEESEGGEMDRVIPVVINACRAHELATVRGLARHRMAGQGAAGQGEDIPPDSMKEG